MEWNIGINILIIFFLFEIKHFICDSLLQTKYHLGKFQDKFADYFPPLFSHVWINGIGTWVIFTIALWVFSAPYSTTIAMPLVFCIMDVVLHFFIDRLKASKKLLGRWSIDVPQFWHALMFDQMLHRLCFICYCYIFYRNIVFIY